MGLRKYAATKTAEDIRVAVADYSDKVHKAWSSSIQEAPEKAGLGTTMPIVLTSTTYLTYCLLHLHWGSNGLSGCGPQHSANFASLQRWALHCTGFPQGCVQVPAD